MKNDIFNKAHASIAELLGEIERLDKSHSAKKADEQAVIDRIERHKSNEKELSDKLNAVARQTAEARAELEKTKDTVKKILDKAEQDANAIIGGGHQQKAKIIEDAKRQGQFHVDRADREAAEVDAKTKQSRANLAELVKASNEAEARLAAIKEVARSLAK